MFLKTQQGLVLKRRPASVHRCTCVFILAAPQGAAGVHAGPVPAAATCSLDQAPLTPRSPLAHRCRGRAAAPTSGEEFMSNKANI